MKIYTPIIAKNHVNPITDALESIGMQVVHDDTECDFVYFGKNVNYKNYLNVPEKFANYVNLDLTLKDKLHSLCQTAGINFIESEIIVDSNTILNFPENNIFIKPVEGGASLTNYTFVYKTFTSKTELLAKIAEECPTFFDLNDEGISIAKTFIIQKAFLTDSDGLLNQYFAGVYVNGQSEMLTEGIGFTKIKFNEFNDVDDVTYPLRTLRKQYIRNMEDQTDLFGIFYQLEKLIKYYSIKNTPINTQWLVDEDGQAFLIDLAYNYQRGLYCTSLVPKEKFAAKMKFVYDMVGANDDPLTGWNGMTDILLPEICDDTKKSNILQYAESLGFVVAESWVIGTLPVSKTIPMSFLGTSEQDCLSRLELLENYIKNI
jgi:hypothetical protein